MAPQVALALGFQVDQSVSNCAMACSWPGRFTVEGAAGESGERFVPRLKNNCLRVCNDMSLAKLSKEGDKLQTGSNWREEPCSFAASSFFAYEPFSGLC